MSGHTANLWRVDLTCCGYDDGHWFTDTWEAANAFRETYTSGAGVATHGYSSTPADGPGHQRSAVVVSLVERGGAR